MGCLIPLSFMCGIIAGILIWRGGEMSKRTEEVEARLRGALEKERRNLPEGDNHAGRSIDNERDDEPTREKQKVHTGVQGSSDAIKVTSFDANREHEVGPQDKQSDREEGLASESPTSQTSLKPIMRKAQLLISRRIGKTGQLHETSQLVPRI
jgi:hypothetical protein